MCSLGEGKPLALTEANVCARPAVVTDVGGNAELIEDGVTGFVAESATLNSFARAMERAWEKRSRWEEMGALAHTKILNRFEVLPERQLLELLESIT
jgi:glycosyltransferase involved in cell wall biosynthesis